MSEQVEKFDPAKLMDGVRDRIKATFISLIPDNAWDEMVKAETERFFKQDQAWDRWKNDRDKLSPFQILIHTELNDHVKKRMRDYLDGPDFQITWDVYGQPTASEHIKKMVIDNAGAVLSSMYAGMASSMIQNLKKSYR